MSTALNNAQLPQKIDVEIINQKTSLVLLVVALLQKDKAV